MAGRPDLNMGGEGTVEQVQKTTGDLREELERLGQAARDAAYEQVGNLRDKGMEGAHQLEDRIRQDPLRSVMIAAGVGFLFGVLWMRD